MTLARSLKRLRQQRNKKLAARKPWGEISSAQPQRDIFAGLARAQRAVVSDCSLTEFCSWSRQCFRKAGVMQPTKLHQAREMASLKAAEARKRAQAASTSQGHCKPPWVVADWKHIVQLKVWTSSCGVRRLVSTRHWIIKSCVTYKIKCPCAGQNGTAPQGCNITCATTSHG